VLQIGYADPPVQERIAIWTDSDQVANLVGEGLIFHDVTGRRFGDAAADTVDFPRLTRLLVFYPSGLKECGELMAKNQHWSSAITGWEPSLDPCAHCIFMNAKQTGDLFDQIAAVDLDQARVWVTLSHDGYSTSVMRLFYAPVLASPQDRVFLSSIFPRYAQHSGPQLH
jgi:hypothetical protein